MAKHLTPDTADEINSSLLITYTYSLGEENTMQGDMLVALGNKVNKQGLGEAGSVVPGRCDAPWFPQEDVGGLSE